MIFHADDGWEDINLPTAPPPIRTMDLEFLIAWLYLFRYSTDPVFSSDGIVPGAAKRVPDAATK